MYWIDSNPDGNEPALLSTTTESTNGLWKQFRYINMSTVHPFLFTHPEGMTHFMSSKSETDWFRFHETWKVVPIVPVGSCLERGPWWRFGTRKCSLRSAPKGLRQPSEGMVPWFPRWKPPFIGARNHVNSMANPWQIHGKSHLVCW